MGEERTEEPEEPASLEIRNAGHRRRPSCKNAAVLNFQHVAE